MTLSLGTVIAGTPGKLWVMEKSNYHVVLYLPTCIIERHKKEG